MCSSVWRYRVLKLRLAVSMHMELPPFDGPLLECLLDKLRHNAVLGSSKPILNRRTGFVEY